MSMPKNPWDGIIPEAEQAAYRAAGFGRPSGLGRRPALLIIDVQYRTVGTAPMPFDDAIKEFATSCGAVGWAAVGHIEKLLTPDPCQAVVKTLPIRLNPGCYWVSSNRSRAGGCRCSRAASTSRLK